MNQASIDISVVIPLMNEEGSLVELHRQLTEVLSGLAKSYELIFVDDGSTDNSYHIIADLHARDKHVEVIKFRRNFGKAAALQAGVDVARGELIFTMDADLQDSPDEIPRFLEALEADGGVDIVSGWKKKRHDPIGKTAPSRLFNWATRKVSGLELNDFNCGFKVYRREVFDHVSLYGELHRYVPVLAGWKGFKVGEIAVEHRAREHGVSKYGMERMLKGLFDLLTIYVTRKYSGRPLHIFGALGFVCSFLGIAALMYLTALWFLDLGPIGTRPLMFLGILLTLFGAQLISFGLLAEMISKSENRHDKPFVISARLTQNGKTG
jgi:glycosyltransferase involved in cell wall biosynthesis